jgi:aspartokinase-like uncharacterized kinase
MLNSIAPPPGFFENAAMQYHAAYEKTAGEGATSRAPVTRLSELNEQPVVLKLGGSLLTCADLMDRLQSAIRLLAPLPVLIIVGGGTGADLLRDLERRFHVRAEKSHWDAIATMTSNARMLCRMSGSLRLVANRTEAAEVWAGNTVAVLDASAFLKDAERVNVSDALPASWDVTSDSIALWTAVRWPASRLILAKSCEPHSPHIGELVTSGSIDAWFTHVRGECPIEWMNLRGDTFNRTPLCFDSSPPSQESPSTGSLS